MVTGLTIEADAEGRTLEALTDLIAKRQQYLKNESTEAAVTATAINILTSLRAETKTAPTKSRGNEYTIEELGTAGWRGGRGNRRRTAIIGGHHVPGVYPVNWMYGLKGEGKYFLIRLKNPNVWPVRAKNAPCYLILAPTIAEADKFARERFDGDKRWPGIYKRERNLAKYALGIVAAQVSNRPADKLKPEGSRAQKVAAENAHVTKEGSGVADGNYSIEVNDTLNYSLPAIGGSGTLNAAMQKAANRTAAIINKLAGYRLDEPIPTPFPEIAKK